MQHLTLTGINSLGSTPSPGSTLRKSAIVVFSNLPAETGMHKETGADYLDFQRCKFTAGVSSNCL
jgi:hypothetical protein